MITKPIRTRVFIEGEDLVKFITGYVPKLKEGSVLVVTSKIVALAEKRTAVISTPKEREALVRAESTFALPTKYVWMTMKDGQVLANAGIDDSNADGKVILLPKDSYKAAKTLHTKLKAHYGLRDLGILITDSRVLPLRKGVVGTTLGYAGFKGLYDYTGTKDIFGRIFRFESTSVADGLAASAVLVMGEGAEQQPLAVIEGGPVTFHSRVDRNELTVPPEDDIYLPFFGKLPKRR